MKFVSAVLVAILLRRGADALDPLPDNSTVPECRVPYNPKILELSVSPTGAPINYGPPLATAAPVTKAPTGAPLKAPTGTPVKAPTGSPVKSPTSAPVKPPTKPPTSSPVKPPTKAPTDAPIKPPTKAPTASPVKPPTKAPTGAPVKAPTKRPTGSPVKPPTKAPTGVPVKAPTKRPTGSPVKPPTKSPTGSPVKPPTKSPTSSPVKPPTKSPTRAPQKPPTKSPTGSPVKPPTKSPTKAPTFKPTKTPTRAPVAPTNMCVAGSVTMAQQWGTIAYPEMPITVVPGSQTGSSVTISVKQVWKSSSISWISTRFTDPVFNAVVCPKKNEVNPGLVDYSSGSAGAYELKNYVKTYGTTFTAKCENGAANVEVYVHDGTYDGQLDMVVPDECSPSNDYSKKIGYKFTVPCSVCVSGAPPPAKLPTKSPTKAPIKPPTNPTAAPVKPPTKSPTKAPVKPPTKAPTAAPVKPPTKSPTKAPVKPPTKSPTKAPVKPPTKSPTKAPVKPPTKSPTKAPTITKVCPATLVGQQGTISLPSMPIKVVPGSQTGGGTVQFQVEQVWKDSTISWISTRFVNPGDGKVVCPKKNEVPTGLVNYANGSPGGSMEVAGACSTTSWGYVMTAKCVNNVASVQVYVHDGQYQGQPDINVPSECSPSSDSSKKIGYNFTVPCTCL